MRLRVHLCDKLINCISSVPRAFSGILIKAKGPA